MLYLTTLGGVALTRDRQPIVSLQNRRQSLALLALLAASGARGMSRETVVALLWPDGGVKDARHSLDQMLSVMRGATGGHRLFLGTSTLQLDPEGVTSDVGEFEAAHRARQLERAVALYRGPFADGLQVEGQEALQQRLEDVRLRLARDHAAILETLARDAATRGDHPAAARWWESRCAADRLSTSATKGLIAALAASGETTRALRVALGYQALVRQELGAEDPDVAQWTRRLRSASPDAVPAGQEDVAAGTTPARESPASRQPAPDAYEQRRRSRLARALGRRYRVDELTHDGTVTATYAGGLLEGVAGAVEIHVLQPRLAVMTSPERFLDVFRRVMAIGGPHVVPALDARADDDLLLYVSARRAPDTLRKRLVRERQLPIGEAIGIARGIAAALAAAHAHGVRHGDLRPKHVGLVGSEAQVGAFGVLDAVSPDADPDARSTIVMLGSPPYLSPEQLLGETHADTRSDVYSFGCVVFEMLVGEPPFGRSARSAGRQRLTQPPPLLRELRDTVPAALEHVVRTCLARVPADRYATGELLLRALAEVDAPATAAGQEPATSSPGTTPVR
jgi:DNA-binding SARP family transcriptional activator